MLAWPSQATILPIDDQATLLSTLGVARSMEDRMKNCSLVGVLFLVVGSSLCFDVAAQGEESVPVVLKCASKEGIDWAPWVALLGAAASAWVAGWTVFVNKDLAAQRAKFEGHLATLDRMAASNLSLAEYQRTQRATHLVKLFDAAYLPASRGTSNRQRANELLGRLRHAYLDGAGLFLGGAADTYHRVCELLEDESVKQVTDAAVFKGAVGRMLSTLRTALIREVQGGNPAQEAAATKTIEGFLRDTASGVAGNREQTLVYLANLHAYLERKDASQHAWLSPEELRKKS